MIALGAVAWKHQGVLPRIVTVVLALPALGLCLVCLSCLF